MAITSSTAKEKTPVDHSAISGPAKPAEPAKGPETKGDFLATMGAVLEKNKPAAAAALNAAASAGAAAVAATPSKPPGLLGMIQNGRQMTPPRILLAGTEGIGKSTFASKAPKPIFIPTEDGLNQIECDRFPVSKTFPQFRGYLTAVATEKHGFQTVAVDSLDWLERLIWDQVCLRVGKKSIEDIGYAKGYIFALDEWRETLDLLERCHARGMAVILIAHAKIEKYEDPEYPTYDRYSPRLHKHAQALMTEWVDAVLFAMRRMLIRQTEGDERNVAAPIGAHGGERIIKTTGSPTCVAKNRYNLQPEIPLSWEAFAAGFAEFFKSQKSVA